MRSKNCAVLLAVLVLSGCGSLYKGDLCLSNIGAQSAACVNADTGAERVVPWSETMNWLMVPKEDTATLLQACRLNSFEVNMVLEAFERAYKRNGQLSRSYASSR